MIRRLLLDLLGACFLFWLLCPRAWLPARRHGFLPLAVPSMNAALLSDAAADSPDAVAVVLLAPDQDAFAAARVLRSAGVPFTVTRDLDAALRHRMVFVPGGEKAIHLTTEQRVSLRVFVNAGGTLIVQSAGLPVWPELTGVAVSAPSRGRRLIDFRPRADAGFRDLTSPGLRTVRLASDSVSEGIWTAGLTPRRGAADVLAVFPGTKEGAILRRRIGEGRVYLLGFDLRDVFVRPQTARSFDASPAGADAPAPGADAWPLLFRAWYESVTPVWARLRSLPGETSGLLLLSHSIESGDSPAGARQTAVWESSRGVASTWFIQTNESDAGQPGPLYGASIAALVRDISANGHELAAHTVSLPPDFAALPFGTGLERRSDYRPETVNGRLWDATVMGEIRVPKRVLERDVDGAIIAGFKSPGSAYPEILDEALAASGYSWDSSLSLREVQSYRPFLLTRRRTMLAESRVVELPTAFSDERPLKGPPPEAPDILRALNAASAEEGVLAWHSRPTERNRDLEASVLERLPPGTAVWTLGRAARWWAAREGTRLRLGGRQADGSRVLDLSLPPEADGADLSVEFSSTPVSCDSTTPGVEIRCAGALLTVLKTSGVRNAVLRIHFEKLDPPEPPRVPHPKARERPRTSRHRRKLRRPHARVPDRRPERQVVHPKP